MAGATLSAAERRRLAPLAAALASARDASGPPRLEPVTRPIPAAGAAAPGAPGTWREGVDSRLPRATVGLLAGTFNPFTRAHAALAVAGHRAGCRVVVLAMAPVSLAKEGLERAHPVDRLDWVAAWARRHHWAVPAAASHPLLVDMAEALGRASGGRVALLLGADKAAQLVEPRWYDDPAAAMDRLGRAAILLVAERVGHRAPDLPVAAAPLSTAAWVPERSATQARHAAARGLPLGDLLPAVVARGVERTGAYAPGDAYQARIRALEALGVSGGHGRLGFRPEAPDRRR
jgi:nicotinic acid mononucleotide adenylyltransferase